MESRIAPEGQIRRIPVTDRCVGTDGCAGWRCGHELRCGSFRRTTNMHLLREFSNAQIAKYFATYRAVRCRRNRIRRYRARGCRPGTERAADRRHGDDRDTRHAIAQRRCHQRHGAVFAADHIEVSLKLRNTSELNGFIQAAAQPNATQRTMSSEEFLAQHSPTAEQAQAVVDYLTQSGFHNIVVAPNRLLVSADGTADIAQTAFQTT